VPSTQLAGEAELYNIKSPEWVKRQEASLRTSLGIANYPADQWLSACD